MLKSLQKHLMDPTVISSSLAAIISLLMWSSNIYSDYQQSNTKVFYFKITLSIIVIVTAFIIFKKRKRKEPEELKELQPIEDGPVGRKKEFSSLMDFIAGENNSHLMILTGESGCGKTSFIKAGLLKELEKKGHSNFFPILLRQYENHYKTIFKRLSDYEIKDISYEEDINYYSNLLDWKGKTPIFIFDQFEQLYLGSHSFKEIVLNNIKSLLKEKRSKIIIVVRSETFKDTIMSFYDETRPVCSGSLFTKKKPDCSQSIRVIDLPLLNEEEAIAFINFKLSQNNRNILYEFIVKDLQNILKEDKRKKSGSEKGILPIRLRIVIKMIDRLDISNTDEYEKEGKATGLEKTYITESLEMLEYGKMAPRAIFSLCDPAKGSVMLSIKEMANIAQADADEMKQAVDELIKIKLLLPVGEQKYRIVHEYIGALLQEQGGRFINPVELQEFQMRRKVLFYHEDLEALSEKNLRVITKVPTERNKRFGWVVFIVGILVLLFGIINPAKTQSFWIDVTFAPAFISGMSIAILTYSYYVNFLSRIMQFEGIIGTLFSLFGSIVFLPVSAALYFFPQWWTIIVGAVCCFGSIKDWQLENWSESSASLKADFHNWGITVMAMGIGITMFGIAINISKRSIEITSIWNKVFLLEMGVVIIIFTYIYFMVRRFYSLSGLRKVISRANMEVLSAAK